MRIQQIAKNYYAVFYKDEVFYGTLVDALNETLSFVFFGKQAKLFADVLLAGVSNIPPGYNNEGDPSPYSLEGNQGNGLYDK